MLHCIDKRNYPGMMDTLQKLRRSLHKHPELSGQEYHTAQRIKEFIRFHHDTLIIDEIGGSGLAAIYEFTSTGPCIVIRCELDALPIHESEGLDYASEHPGISHKCGHDGHMAIVCGLIFWLKKQNFQSGKIVLLFQPAEENGMGARSILQDPKFDDIKPDYVFALHNIPGKPVHSVIICPYIFSPSVTSFALYLEGKEAHASEPENGINPSKAICTVIQKFEKLNVSDAGNKNFSLLTPVYMNMGKKAYGIAAGNGEVHFTIRTWTEKKMSRLQKKIKELAQIVSSNYDLKHRFEWFDYFPTVKNDLDCNEIIMQAAESNKMKIIIQKTPFKFGEDFGWFAQKYKAAMFGLGAGKNCPGLHHDDYDFPDKIIPSGIKIFAAIITRILNNESEQKEN